MEKPIKKYLTGEVRDPNSGSIKSGFIVIQPHPFIYVLPMAAFTPEGQSWINVTEKMAHQSLKHYLSSYGESLPTILLNSALPVQWSLDLLELSWEGEGDWDEAWGESFLGSEETEKVSTEASGAGMALQNASKLKWEGWLWFSSSIRRGRNLSWGSSVQGTIPQVRSSCWGRNTSYRSSDAGRSKTASSTFLSIYFYKLML